MQFLGYKCDRCGFLTEDPTALTEIAIASPIYEGAIHYTQKKVSLCPCCMSEKNQLDEKFMRREPM